VEACEIFNFGVSIWRKTILLRRTNKEIRLANVGLICGRSNAIFFRIRKLLIIRKDLVSDEREKLRLTSSAKLDQRELGEFSELSIWDWNNNGRTYRSISMTLLYI
jgi:hypothetical protein